MSAVRSYVGASLGETEWFPITREQVERFGIATGDRNWLHYDPERAARESPWKTTVVPGYLLLSLLPTILPRLLVVLGWQTAINSGAEDCTFPGVAPVDGRVRLRAQITRGRTLPGGGCRLGLATTFDAEGCEEPACQATVNYLYYP
jgi:acyl dehydratase